MEKITVDEFSKRSIKRHGIELYNREDAINLVYLCQQENIKVLGIDAFILFGDAIQPSMENSIDLSYEENGYELAKKFLNDRVNTEFVYEIVY